MQCYRLYNEVLLFICATLFLQLPMEVLQDHNIEEDRLDDHQEDKYWNRLFKMNTFPKQYMLFFSFITKPLIWLACSTSRTGIVIGRLLNAQLHHMSVPLRGGINHLYFGHRLTVVSLEFSLSLSFAFKCLINARAHCAFTFISGQLLI